tara:strand:+ start:93 stop:335 length:243 start_codon:yes stop_codon:yes gene_type:complete
MRQASYSAVNYRPFVLTPHSVGDHSDSLPKQNGGDIEGREKINNDYYDYDDQWDYLYDEAIEQGQKRKREKSSNKNNDTW